MTRGVLLDVDGTLVDTNHLHAVAWAEAFAQQDRVVPTADIHSRIGMGAERLIEELGGKDVVDEITAAHTALYGQWAGHLRALPGARDLLKGLKDRGLTVVLASSASEREMKALLTALDAEGLYDDVTTSADAEGAKPAPDILQVALDKAGLSASDAVMVGDAVWDGEAAERAGLRFVGVTCGGTSEQALRGAGAVEVWAGPQALLDGLGGSVLQG
jgi:HAD superfamily hydrolase (TIGR01509 family)